MCRSKNTFIKRLPALFFILIIIFPLNVSAVEDFERIKSELDSDDWGIRLAAVEKLGIIRNEESINLLIDVAERRGETWQIKKKAILLLGEIKDPKAIGHLLSIFNDPFLNWECPAIKSYAAISLGNFKGNVRVIEALINGINDRELLTREASIRSLGKIGDPKAVSLLINLLKDSSIAIKLSSIKALEDIGDLRAIPYLRRAAERDTDSLIRNEIASALNNFREKQYLNSR
ncbi:MAG: HEAT repeat domain-containing protein [Nitrospirota bacterium]